MGTSYPREMRPGPVHEGEPVGCLKVGYESETEAAEAGRKYKQKAYRCPICQKWHLTKHARFRWRDIGRRR